MRAFLRRLLGLPSRTVRVVRAKYDAAQTTAENRRHWANADGLSARLANSLAVRTKLRERARYERDNGGFCDGMVDSLVNEVVGVGPRLQVRTGDRAADRAVQDAWHTWADEVLLGEGLQILHRSRVVDGEGFCLLSTDDTLTHSVKLFPVWVECDQVTTPNPSAVVRQAGTFSLVDGIELSRVGRPVAYHVLRSHPGDLLGAGWEYDVVAARRVIHWFLRKRAGQVRGVPEITPGLPLMAQKRRWTLATLSAAETAANFAAMLETQAPPDGTTDDPTPFETLEIVRGMMTTLPAGTKAAQLKAEHPTALYDQFEACLLREFARPLHMPLNVAIGDSSRSNFASGRLDYLLYRMAIRVTRHFMGLRVMEPLFSEWLQEATRVPGLLPPNLPAVGLPHLWFWPGFQPIDPDTEAKSDTEALLNGTTTLAELLAEVGLDWEEVVRQRAAEIALCNKLGVPLPSKASTPAGGAQTPAPAPSDQGATP